MFLIGGYASKYGYASVFDDNMLFLRSRVRDRGFVVAEGTNLIASWPLSADHVHFSSDIKGDLVEFWATLLRHAQPPTNWVSHPRDIAPYTILEIIHDYNGQETVAIAGEDMAFLPVVRGQCVCSLLNIILGTTGSRYPHYVAVCKSGAAGGSQGLVPIRCLQKLWSDA